MSQAPRANSQQIPGGVFAINKPTGISSAQAIRDMQHYFGPSNYFASLRQQQFDRLPKRKRRHQTNESLVKLGHGGTLDPLATGVLIMGLGDGTKSLSNFLHCTKTYEAVVLFGAATDTYDRVGKVVARNSFQHITKEMVEEALVNFRGNIKQKPPIFSALRQNGKRLYEYAREGLELPKEIEARSVEVLELELIDWMEGGTHNHTWPEQEAEEIDKAAAEKMLNLKASTADNVNDSQSAAPKRRREFETPELDAISKKPKLDSDPNPEAPAVIPDVIQDPESAQEATGPKVAESSPSPPAIKLRMTVSSGFYVRSLCHDLGEAVGSLALMSELVRTRQGDFEVGKNAVEYSDFAKGENVWLPQVSEMLDAWNEKT